MTKNKRINIILLIITLILIGIAMYIEISRNYVGKPPVKLEQPEFFLSEHPNIKLVMEACEYYQLEEKGIVVSQAILETGHFRSNNCIKNHNLFGLYNSKLNQYYKFNHWTESVVAYRDKIQYKKRANEKYYDFLNRIGYAEDKDYISKVKNIKKRFKL